jgi:hypothetical protein
LENRDDARLGFNAAISAFHLSDVFHAFYTPEEPKIVERWPKHLYAKGGHYEVGSPGAVWGLSIPGEEIELESDWEGCESDVLVRRRDGSTVSLTLALGKVIDEMWPTFLPNEDRFNMHD